MDADMEKKSGGRKKATFKVFVSKESVARQSVCLSVSIYKRLFAFASSSACRRRLLALSLFSPGTWSGASVLTSTLARSGGLPNQIIK